jgi:hypothetical protein
MQILGGKSRFGQSFLGTSERRPEIMVCPHPRETGIGSDVMKPIASPIVGGMITSTIHDAGSYAPTTVLADERADGVNLSYDRMASFLAPYGNAKALTVARDLDSKIETSCEKQHLDEEILILPTQGTLFAPLRIITR